MDSWSLVHLAESGGRKCCQRSLKPLNEEKEILGFPPFSYIPTSTSQFSQFSRSVVSDSLRPHELQHARPPGPSPTPGVHSDSRLSSQPSSHLSLCHPLLLLPSIPPNIRVFSSESTLRMRWPKNWSFSFSIIPSKEIPGLISFRMGLVGSPCSPRDSQESSPTHLGPPKIDLGMFVLSPSTEYSAWHKT